ncbi:MAG: aminoacyl--tRNA ligase-related protein [Candidatus Heimdallarchaeota archaeon]
MFHTKNLQNDSNISDKSLETSTKNKDFWTWYLWILKTARIVDTNYSVKGSYVWLDWGYALYHSIYTYTRDMYQGLGHKQMQFPTLIKEETFLMETEFIRNFEDDVFWVDREGHKQLERGERLALRPTSELIIYPMFSRWIHSWRDLPLKVFQNVSIFRCETNETRPLIRNRETIGFIEGHSAFENEVEAKTFLKTLQEGYRKLFSKLGIPVKYIQVPDWDRFAGSTLTVDGYVLLPGSKAMELFTTAYLGTTFSKIFDITYLNDNKESMEAHLLCYGPSIDRILASIIGIYGDDRGLRLLSSISPIEIIITPIFNRKNREEVLTHARFITQKLMAKGFTVELDDNLQTTPGEKFYRAERLGIPIRLEIGARELANNQITVTRRDTLQKETIDYDNSKIKRQLKNKLRDIDTKLKAKAANEFKMKQVAINTWQQLRDLVSKKKLFTDHLYLLGWCGQQNCAEKIETETSFTLLGYDNDSLTEIAECLVCKQQGKISVLSKRY